VKESEIPGLLDLRIEYEKKIAGLKEYQELKAELDKTSMALIKEAMHSKSIKLETGLEDKTRAEPTTAMVAESCGIFCTTCITPCVSCVGYV
jgi:hypothetical protein